MFGWEFPPHITGGLGTACYGLTKGLSIFDDLDLLFVVPKAFGDETPRKMSLLGANDVYLSEQEMDVQHLLHKINYLQVNSKLIPYTSPEEYEELSKKYQSEKHFIQTKLTGKLNFEGGYGESLFQEIANYAVVASTISHENTFDIIHAHDWLTYPAGMAAKHISGKPLVVHVHATDFDRSGGKVNPEVYRIEKEGMEAADKIIAVSNLTRNTVIHKYNIPEEKVVTVYNAVEPAEHTHEAGIKKGVNEKVVTFLGRVTMQKGPKYFIEAAYKVLQKMRNVRFVMAGSGDMLEKMIAHTAKLKITDRFHFTGFLRGNDVSYMFSVSDLYVMPSVSEPFGIVPLEAMLSNVPVIISHQSGVAEILTHAIKTDFWDIDAMADAIYGVLNYEALSKMFKKYGKTEVENLKWENSAKEVKDIYKQLV